MSSQVIRRSALGAGIVTLAIVALLLLVLAVLVSPFIADGIVVWGEVIPPRDPRLAHHILGWRLVLCVGGVLAITGAYRCWRAFGGRNVTQPSAG